MKTNSKFFTSPFFILSIFVIAGLILRLLLAKSLGYFWFDELFSVYFSSMSLNSMINYVIYDNHPLLFPILLHFWIKIFGDGEIVVRMMSIIFGLFSIVTIYYLGKELFNKKVGLIAAFLLTFTPYALYYTTEARMYSLLLFFTILSTLLFWKFIKSPTLLKGVLFGVGCFFILHTHLLAAFVILLFNIFYLINYFYFKDKKIRIAHWLYLQFLLLVTFCSWFFIFIYIRLGLFSNQMLNLNDIWFLKTYFLSDNFFNLILKSLILNNFFDYYLEPLMNVFILIIFLAFINVNIYKSEINIKLDINRKKIFLSIFILVILLLGFILQKPFPRYYIIILPAFYILLSAGLIKINKKALSIILIILSLILLSSYKYEYYNSKDDEQVVQYLEQNSNKLKKEKIIHHVFDYKLVLDKYYKGNIPTEGFYPLQDFEDENYRLIIKNYQRGLINEGNINKLSESIKGYDRILFIFTTKLVASENELIKKWFLEHDYQEELSKMLNGTEIVIFNKINNEIK